jgi:hypothetical protein
MPQIGATDYVPPKFKKKAFHCPHCAVYAPQQWTQLFPADGDVISRAHRSTCLHCRKHSYWLANVGLSNTGRMVEPEGSLAALQAHADMPDDCREDYEEARAIVERSPRGACGLLRVVVEKLCADLGESGKDLNSDIGNLVRKGLDPKVQKALDSLRVIGNGAVHPGEMNLKDDQDTAAALFGWINFIVDQMITRPKQLDALYASLPESKLAGIERRDTAP